MLMSTMAQIVIVSRSGRTSCSVYVPVDECLDDCAKLTAFLSDIYYMVLYSPSGGWWAYDNI